MNKKSKNYAGKFSQDVGSIAGSAGTAPPSGRLNVIHDCLIELAAKLEVKNGTLLWPVRIAAAGTLVTPAAPWNLTLLGREEALRRLRAGLAKF